MPTASRIGGGSRATECAPTSDDRSRRLVARMRLSGVPGSSASTCSALAALSSTRRMRRSAMALRYRAVSSSQSAGSVAPVGSRLRSTRVSTDFSSGRVPPGCVNPCRSTKSCPSGYREANVWATHTAREVFPTPAMPCTATTEAPSSTAVRSASRWSPRPVNAVSALGSSRGTVAARSGEPVSSARPSDSRPSASASSRTVFGCGRTLPDSMSRTVRIPRPALAASSPCDIIARNLSDRRLLRTSVARPGMPS
jgi:hypothetical protein